MGVTSALSKLVVQDALDYSGDKFDLRKKYEFLLLSGTPRKEVLSTKMILIREKLMLPFFDAMRAISPA
jgi:hypothetical protein